MAAVYRAYYALNRNPRLNSKGLNTSSILGFTTTLYDLIRQQRPTHIGVAFDMQKPTFRHEMYEQYKANRDAMPEDIQHSLPYIFNIIEAFGIPILTCEGYEADDVIGTLSHKAEEAGFDEILMVTPDKDFGQLVTPHIKMYRHGRMGKPDEILGEEAICEKFGVCNCLQIIDLLGLWGDSSDNIPGIPGIGEKTAKKLIDQFGSIEAMIAGADDIKNDKIRNLVKENSEQALFSKQLATIVQDAPIAFDAEMLALKTPDYTKLKGLFDELEFRNLSKRIFTDLSITDPEMAMQFSQKKPDLQPSQPTLFDTFQEQNNSIATESENLTRLDQLPTHCDISIHIDNTSVAIATSTTETYCKQLPDIDIAALKTVMESPSIKKICYNLKELKYKMQALDICVSDNVFDIQLAHYLINSEQRHTLDFIISEYLNIYSTEEQNTAAIMWHLYPMMEQQLKESNMMALYTDLELPLVDVLISMEQEGVNIDTRYLESYSQQLGAERNVLEQEIYDYAGETFNINSPKQLGVILYEKLAITSNPPLTATKQYSTSEDVLVKLSDKHIIVKKILEYRSLNKLISTYLDSFPKLINPISNRLHTIYNQTVTSTGRLSSSNPNLQNIPIRTERGREIRKAFVARDSNHQILAADYSQIELRIIASLSGDKQMLNAFTNHLDIHADTAATIYHLEHKDVTSELRRNAKAVNFGIIYGISAFGLSEQLGISRKEASQLIDNYFEQYPEIKSYIDTNIAYAREHGYAQTLLGRRRYLNDINSRNNNARNFAERNAVNMPIQGTSADMIKIAMIRIHNRLKEEGMRSKMILQVHDELVFDMYNAEEAQLRKIVEEEMMRALHLDIPVEVSINVGNNWLEAH